MKLKRILLLVILLVATSSAQAKVWAMYCKTGPGLNVHINYSINSGPASLDIYYNKASKAAGNNFENLKPGECAWPDRPIRSDERGSAVFRYGVMLGAKAPFMTIVVGNEEQPTQILLRDSKLNGLRSTKGEKFKMQVQMENGELKIQDKNGDPDIEYVK
ncbi:MAG: hypothetical protein JNM27_09200 [Leptospirales bacterium]|nr:hypothetical protein [Leptospirales bacterium]